MLGKWKMSRGSIDIRESEVVISVGNGGKDLEFMKIIGDVLPGVAGGEFRQLLTTKESDLSCLRRRFRLAVNVIDQEDERYQVNRYPMVQ